MGGNRVGNQEGFKRGRGPSGSFPRRLGRSFRVVEALGDGVQAFPENFRGVLNLTAPTPPSLFSPRFRPLHNLWTDVSLSG